MRLPIETGSTLGELAALLDRASALHGPEAHVRGSVVIWSGDEPVMVIGLAPEYENQ